MDITFEQLRKVWGGDMVVRSPEDHFNFFGRPYDLIVKHPGFDNYIIWSISAGQDKRGPVVTIQPPQEEVYLKWTDYGYQWDA